MAQEFWKDVDPTYSTPPFFTQPRDLHGASLIRELSPTEDLRDMVENLRGKIWDSNLQKYVRVEGVKPFMNDDGIDAFFQYATILLNKVNTMSNYANNYKTIHALIIAVSDSAIRHFTVHWQDYGIRNKTSISIVTRKIFVLGLSAFYKAIGAGERKAATANISETINRVVRESSQLEEQKPKSFIERMFRR